MWRRARVAARICRRSRAWRRICAARRRAETSEPSPFLRRRTRPSALAERSRPSLGWRLAIPAFAVAVVLVLTTSREHPAAPPETGTTVAVAPDGPNTPKSADKPRDLSPTLLNYQMAADQSWEKLDRLLNEQASMGLGATPIYRAGSLAGGGLER